MFKNGKKTLSFLLAIAMIATLIPANIAFASTAEKGTALTSRADVNADIRFALFGDTHVTVNPVWTTADAALDKIMDAYKTIDANMDAFVMPGDVIYNVAPADEKTTNDVVKYNAVLAEINEEFPTASPASNIIWSMGNHEITLGAYKGTATTNFTAGTWEQEVADNHAKYEEALGRKPIDTYTVNGYTFVTSAPYDYLNNYVNPNDKTVMSAYETTIKGYLEAALKADATKPVFYLQHEAMDATNIASNSTIPTRNSEAFREFVVSNPRIITLSGHSHYAANDPRTFLQLENGSTHINIPATMGAAGSYGCTKDSVTDNASATQGMVVEVTGAEVTVRAFDYVDKKYIGEPYVFTAGAAAKTEYTKAGREAAKTSEVNKAYFENGAAITVSNIKANSAKISFPEGKKDGESAEGLHDDYIHYYRVSVAKKDNGNVVKSYSLLGNYFLNSTNSKKTASRTLSITGLSRGTEYTVTVTPESALGQEGTPLTAEFTTTFNKSEADLALTKKFTQNVARGKTVIPFAVGTPDDTKGNIKNYPASNLTDGTNDFVELRDGLTENDTGITSLVVDLHERKQITSVVLKSRKDARDDNGRKNFNILVSNDPTFKTYDKIGGIGSSINSTLFPVYGDYTVECKTGKAYRYVMLERTVADYCVYSEIEVFADVYMTEVSRNKTVVANKYYDNSFHSKKLVDGENTGDTSAWMSDWSDTNDWAYIDLESTLPIGMIDIEAPVGSTRVGDWSRTSWNILGSNDINTDALNTTNTTWGTTASVSDTDTYTQLFRIKGGYFMPNLPDATYLNTFYSIGDIPSSTRYNGVLRQLVSGNYRYITFHHGLSNLALIGEARVWAINPAITNVSKTDSAITVEFTEPMDADTLNADNITVYDLSGNTISGTYTLSEDGCTLTISGDMANALKVDSSYAVYSQRGMDLAGDLTKYFESDVDLSGKEVITEENVNLVKGVTTIGDKTWSKITDENYTTINEGTVSANSGIGFDLGKRYNIKKIVLTVPSNSSARQNYKIQVSNDPAFADSTTKTLKERGPVAKLTEATEFVDGTTLTLDLDGDTSYRYVRYLNSQNSGKYMHIYEFEVYADRKLTEITRGITPTASCIRNTSTSLSGLTDGVNKSVAGGWESGYNAVADWINVDLGMQLPIVRIEMESNYNGYGTDGTYNNRRYWNIFGSNKTPTETDLNTTTLSGNNAKISAEGYDLLDSTEYACLPNYNQGVFDDQVYYTSAQVLAKWNAGNYGTENGIFRKDFRTPANYRYLTFTNGYIDTNNTKTNASLGEIRAYTLAPFASSYKLNGNTVTVNFSDGMLPNYMTTDYIKLYDADDNIVEMSSAEMVDAYTFKFAADLKPGATYKIVASKDMKTLESMPLNIDNEITIVVPNISSTVTVSDSEGVAESFVAGTTYSFKVNVASPFVADEPNVKVVVAQYNGTQLVKAELADITAVANTTTTATLTDFTYADGNTFKVFTWKAGFDEPYCAIIELGTQE